MSRWSAVNGKPLLMGILNVTPDSFSDGGMYNSLDKALVHAHEMEDQGANIIDVGGESTRPGSLPVSLEDELSRVVPILKDLISTLNVPVSIDTTKKEVAEVALGLGASIVNDVSGINDPGMIKLISSSGASVIIMHMHGTPLTLGTDMMEGDVKFQINKFLQEKFGLAIEEGIKSENIILDPGVGFGKTPDQNLEIIENCLYFSNGFPVAIGTSRKRFLSTIFPDMNKDDATIESMKISTDSGADILRVHDVVGIKKALCLDLKD